MFRFFKRENLRSTRRRSASCPNLECSGLENDFKQAEFQERDGSSSTSASENESASPSRLQRLHAQRSVRRVRKREKEKKENVEKNLISMGDYLAKLPDLKAWLKEERKKDVESIRSPKLKAHFKTFVRLWNKRKLPAKYYRGCCVDADGAQEKSPVFQKALVEEPLTPSFSPFPLPVDLSLQSSVIHNAGSPFSTFGKSAEDPLTSPTALSEEMLSSPTSSQVPRKEVKSMIENSADGMQRFATITRSAQVGSFMRIPRGSVKLQPVDSPKCPTLSHLPDGPSFSLSPALRGMTTLPHDFTLGTGNHNDSPWTLDQEKKDLNRISPAYAYVKDAIPYSQESPKYAELDGEAVRLPESDYCSLSPIREWYPPENQTKRTGAVNSAFGRRRSKSLEDIYAVPVRTKKVSRKCSATEVEMDESKTPPIPDRKYSPKRVFSLLSQIPRPKPFGLIQPQSPSTKIDGLIAVRQFRYENEDTGDFEDENLKAAANSNSFKSPKKRRSQESVQSLQDADSVSKVAKTSSMLSSTPKETLAKEESSELVILESIDVSNSPKLSILTGSLKATTRKPRALEEEMHDSNEARLSIIQLQQFDESPKFPRRKLKRRSSSLSTTPGKGLTFGKNSKMASSSPRRVSFAKDVKDTDEKTTPRRSSNSRKAALPIMGTRSCCRQTRERLQFESFLSAHEEKNSQNKTSNSPTKSPSPSKISPVKMITSFRRGVAEMKSFKMSTMTSTSNKNNSTFSSFVPTKKDLETTGDMSKDVSTHSMINTEGNEMLFPMSPTRQLGRRALGTPSSSPQRKLMKESSFDLTAKSVPASYKRNLFASSDSDTKTDGGHEAATDSAFNLKGNIEGSPLFKSQMQHQVDSFPLVPSSLRKPAQNCKALDSASQNLLSPPPVPSSVGRSPLKTSASHLSEQQVVEILRSDRPPPPLPLRRYQQNEFSPQKSFNNGKAVGSKKLAEPPKKKASTPDKITEDKALPGKISTGSVSPTRRQAEGLIRKLSCLDVKVQDSNTNTEDASKEEAVTMPPNCALNAQTSTRDNSVKDQKKIGDCVREPTPKSLCQQSSSPFKATKFDHQSEKTNIQRKVEYMENSKVPKMNEKKGSMTTTTTFSASGEIHVVQHAAPHTSVQAQPLHSDTRVAKNLALRAITTVKKETKLGTTSLSEGPKKWISHSQADKVVEESVEKSKDSACSEQESTAGGTRLETRTNSDMCYTEQNTQSLEEDDRYGGEKTECTDMRGTDKQSTVSKGAWNNSAPSAGKKRQSLRKPMQNPLSRVAQRDQSAANSGKCLTKPKLFLLEKKENCSERSLPVQHRKQEQKMETSSPGLGSRQAQCAQLSVGPRESETCSQNPPVNKSSAEEEKDMSHFSPRSEDNNLQTTEQIDSSDDDKSISKEGEMNIMVLHSEEPADEKESKDCNPVQSAHNKEVDGLGCSLQRLESIRASPKVVENDSWITARRRSSRGKPTHSFRSAHNRYLLRSASKEEEEELVKLEAPVSGAGESDVHVAAVLLGNKPGGQLETVVKSGSLEESSSERRDADTLPGTHSCLAPERKGATSQDSTQCPKLKDDSNSDGILVHASRSLNVKKTKPSVPPKTLPKPKVVAGAQRRLNVNNFVGSPSSRNRRSSINKKETSQNKSKTGPPVVKRRSSLVAKSPAKSSVSSPSSKVTATQNNSTLTPKRRSSITKSESSRAFRNSSMTQKGNSFKKNAPNVNTDSGKMTPPTPRRTNQRVSSGRRSSMLRRRSKENKGEEENKIASFSERKKFFQQLQSRTESSNSSQPLQTVATARWKKPETKVKMDSDTGFRGTERNTPQTLNKQRMHLALSPQSEMKI